MSADVGIVNQFNIDIRCWILVTRRRNLNFTKYQRLMTLCASWEQTAA